MNSIICEANKIFHYHNFSSFSWALPKPGRGMIPLHPAWIYYLKRVMIQLYRGI